jgi:hypothetical protein
MDDLKLLGRTPKEFIAERLLTIEQVREFPTLSFKAKLGLVELFLTGSETERFAAEPVYSVSGKGKLVSKGVDGLQNEIQLHKYLNSIDGLTKAIPFIEKIENHCIEAGHAEAI